MNSLKLLINLGKGRNSKIYRAIREEVENLQKSYKNLQNDIKSTRDYKTKVKLDNKKSTHKKGYVDTGAKISKKEIDANIEQELKRKLKGIQQIEPRGFKRNVGVDKGVATSKTAMAVEYGGSYPNKFSRQMKLSELEAKKTFEKDTYKKYIDKELAESTNAKLNLTEQQVLAEKANITIKELANEQGKIERNTSTANPEKFDQLLKGAFYFTEQSGKNTWEVISSSLNAAFGRYFNNRGTLGLGYDRSKGEGVGHDQAVEVQKQMLKTFNKVSDYTSEMARQLKVQAQIDPRGAEKEVDKILKSASGGDTRSMLQRELDQITQKTNQQNTLAEQTANINKIESVREAVSDTKQEKIEQADLTSGFNTDTLANKLINTTEDIRNELNHIKEQTLKINLPSSTKDLYKKLPNPAKILGLPKPDGRRKKISDGLKDENPQLALIPIQDAMKKALAVIPGEFAKTLKESIHPSIKDKQRYIDRPEGTNEFEYDESIMRKLADISNARKEARRRQNGNVTPPQVIVPNYQPQVEKSKIYASPIKQTVWDKLSDALSNLTGVTKKYKDVLNATAEEQDRMAAERIKRYGMNNGRNPNDTGDIANIKRALQLFRSNKRSIEENPELAQKIKLTPGREVDTTAITKAFAKALSGKQMRNAQIGGSIPRQILGAFTGFIGMPSLEKSRAQADGLNQILGDINKALQSVLSSIQMKETELAGMEATGEARFDKEGYLTKDSSSAAFKTLADLEEYKLVLDTIQADLLANDEIIKRTGGKFNKLVKKLSFTSPVLRDNNNILRNMNAGLDKNGKALKFQTRTAEILNYTFQLMTRHIGQMIKSWILMMNPINLIKKAFQDFGSYDVKWQRTMNVIKINFQRIIKPAMEWIAQKLVNVIGFFNIISMKVQEAFGKIPIDLFDQAGAQSEKIRRELEAAANVTAGFDELHDIGSDNSGANNLLGDIYKPQLSEGWKKLAEQIGDLFAGLIKGDLGFGEVMKRILEILWGGLKLIATAIWDWFKQTAIGKWITEHWKSLLLTILGIFLTWKLLKIAGSTLFNALFGKLLEKGAITGIFSKIGGWISSGLSSLANKGGILGFIGSFGEGILMAFQTLFTGGKYSLLGTLKEMFTNSAAITEAGSWGSMLGFAITKALGAALAGAAVMKGFDMVADDASYNIGLKANGGKDEDKKSGLGGKLLGAAGGAALAGLVIGGPIAMGIGAIVGLITTSLAPAFEDLEVDARNANNEMQKIEYYEGAVKGAQSQVDIFDEQQKLLKQSLELNTQAVYDQGEKLGISKTRMDELVKATQDGKFTTDMLTGSETGLAGSLTDLAQKQEHVTEVSKKLEEAQKKLLKAQTDLSIAQDVEAGNFELAAARIEVAEAQGVYTTKEATAKRIQLYKEGGEEERKNLLQNLTPDQKRRMGEYMAETKTGLGELSKAWETSSDDTKKAILDSVGEDTQKKLKQNMKSMDAIIQQHTSGWQKIGDVLKEIFTFGKVDTWTFNKEDKYYKEAAKDINKNPENAKQYTEEVLEELKKRKLIQGFAVGTNYVQSDGLAYLHQGEAVIPKKYNTPYQPVNDPRLIAAIEQLNLQVNQISMQVNQGIQVHGQFIQKGSDLVAAVERANNRLSNNILNNRVYAR